MQYVLYYFIAVSVIGAIVCIYDKLAAVRGWRRVSERTLFFWALIGGGPGVYATMLIIRHKTLHHIFMLGIPAIMVLQGAIIVGIYNILYMNCRKYILDFWGVDSYNESNTAPKISPP